MTRFDVGEYMVAFRMSWDDETHSIRENGDKTRLSVESVSEIGKNCIRAYSSRKTIVSFLRLRYVAKKLTDFSLSNSRRRFPYEAVKRTVGRGVTVLFTWPVMKMGDGTMLGYTRHLASEIWISITKRSKENLVMWRGYGSVFVMSRTAADAIILVDLKRRQRERTRLMKKASFVSKQKKKKRKNITERTRTCAEERVDDPQGFEAEDIGSRLTPNSLYRTRTRVSMEVECE